MTNYDLNFFYLVSYGADKFSCFLDVSFIQFSETVKHHDKLDEFYLGFVIHGTESQGSCQITIQASPVSYLIVDYMIPFDGVIAQIVKKHFLAE